MNPSAERRYIKDKKGRAWSHNSVISLLDDHKRNDPEAIIRETAQNLISEAKSIGWSGPPFDPKILASIRGIRVEEATEDIGADARILPLPNGKLKIQYDPSKPSTRVNFSIGHEISHTFFPDCYETVRHRGKCCSSDRTYFELEYLCDVGAAELLLPEYTFAMDAAKHDYTAQYVRELSKLYAASTEAVLIRMSQLCMVPCATVFLSEKHKPSEKKQSNNMEFADFGLAPVPPKLRVDYTCPSEYFDVFIPQDKSVPADSVAYQCFRTNDVIEAFEEWNIPGFGKRRVQAVRLPKLGSDSSRRVAVFVCPK